MTAQEKERLIQLADQALDAVRPHLKVDGGNVEIVDLSDDLELTVKWLGSCEFCSMSMMTMKAGIEQAIKQNIPEIVTVWAVNGLEVV